MTRAQVLEFATIGKFTHIKTDTGAIPIEQWDPKRTDHYDGFKIVGGEIVIDQPVGADREPGFGGAWPLLSRGSGNTK